MIAQTILKTIGAFCVFIGCSTIGIKANRRLRLHISELESLLSALETIEAEIACRLTPIPAALLSARNAVSQNAKSGCSAFLDHCIAQLDTRGPQYFGEIWRTCAAEFLTVMPEGELQILYGLSETLGNYGVEEQTATIRYTRERLGSFLSAAEKEKERSGKVYLTLGATAGIAAVIVLI